MRVAMLLAAIAALWVQATPARAAVEFPPAYHLTFTGVITGKQTIYDCGPFEMDCISYDVPFSKPFEFSLTFERTLFDDGFQDFTNGFFFRGPVGEIKGTIIGLFTPVNVTYVREDPTLITCSVFACRGVAEGGVATQIKITSLEAVPEPGTWAMMLLGFGAIGSAMRRHQRQQSKVRIAC